MSVLVAGPASAGGPTSVLMVQPETRAAASLYYTDADYGALASLVGASDPSGLVGEVDKSGQTLDQASSVTLTWLLHDVAVWRVDRVYLEAAGGPWISTQLVMNDSNNVYDSPVTWHTAADGPALTALLGRMGFGGDSKASGAGAGAASVPDYRAVTPAPEPAPETSQPASPTPTWGGWAWGLAGLALGLALALAAPRAVSRARPRVGGPGRTPSPPRTGRRWWATPGPTPTTSWRGHPPTSCRGRGAARADRLRAQRTALCATGGVRSGERMRILVLGGTVWLGRSIATTAIERGHDVTCLARGGSAVPPDGAAFVRADRDQPDAYDEVARAEWDAVVDVSRQPGQVRRATDALADRAGHFVFTSSGSAYAEHGTPGDDEGAALLPALDGDVMETMATYGEAKVACEQHVRAAFGADRSLVIRIGLIGGPGDIFGRSGYWPLRFARPAAADGSVLVPDAPALPTQVIDVRDLAAWIVDAGTAGLSGTFNATGETIPLPDHLEVARAVAGHTGPLVPVDQDWLLAHHVEPWMGERSLPLWLPLPDFAGFSARDSSAARAAGLATRPLADTLADTLEWELASGPDRPRLAGLTAEEERSLLAAARAPAATTVDG